VEVPAGLSLEAGLDRPIDSEAAIGDAVSATVQREVRRGGTVVIPKGAVLRGRITRLERRVSNNLEYYAVGLTFARLEFEGGRAGFRGDLEDVSGNAAQYYVPYSQNPGRPASIWASVRHMSIWDRRPEEGTFFVRGGRLVLPAGFYMRWLTR
jgi:hypothetical protein